MAKNESTFVLDCDVNSLYNMRMDLSDLQAQLRGLDRNTFLWGPEEGDPILAKDLTVSHLCNIINWILEHENQYDDGVLDFMVGEAEYRRVASFAANEPYIITENVKMGGSARARLENT